MIKKLLIGLTAALFFNFAFALTAAEVGGAANTGTSDSCSPLPYTGISGYGLWSCTGKTPPICWAGYGNENPAICNKPLGTPDSDYLRNGKLNTVANTQKVSPPPIAQAIAAALAVAAALFAGVAIAAAAPLIVPAAAIATALAAAAAAMPYSANKPPITPASLASQPPIKVNMTPSVNSAPEVGTPGGPGQGTGLNAPAAAPTVSTNPNGTFAPRGATPFTDPAVGGWEKTATNEYSYYPPATALNPNPKPTVVIANNGTLVSQTLSSNGNQANEVLTVNRTFEHQTVITKSSEVAVITESGSPAFATVHEQSIYSGLYPPADVPVSQSVQVNSTLSDGTSAASASITVPGYYTPGDGTGSGTGDDPGTGTGTGTGTGDGDGTGGDTCGGPGLPPCNVKIVETGTAQLDPSNFELPEELATATQQHLEKITGLEDKGGLFDSFRSLFSLPPLRQCQPIQFPDVAGMTVPSMDPCPATEWLRAIMAFVWAFAGTAFCWSCVEEATKV